MIRIAMTHPFPQNSHKVLLVVCKGDTKIAQSGSWWPGRMSESGRPVMPKGYAVIEDGQGVRQSWLAYNSETQYRVVDIPAAKLAQMADAAGHGLATFEWQTEQ